MAPVLAAIVVGIEKIDAHDMLQVQRHTSDCDRMPANKTTAYVRYGNASGLGMDQGAVTVVGRVVNCDEVTNESLVVKQLSGRNVNGETATASNPPAVDRG